MRPKKCSTFAAAVVTIAAVAVLMTVLAFAREEENDCVDCPVSCDYFICRCNCHDGDIADVTQIPGTEITGIRGDANLDGLVTIADALEILKHLAGMDSAIQNSQNSQNSDKSWRNSIITGGEEPSIADVLEILKALAKMESLVEIY
ncbi:MAG: hypothetical protein FWG83_07020 [Oscillospiraceae bacterium]|nr:hypothetical protein [Oscillospiraceae bacterium]